MECRFDLEGACTRYSDGEVSHSSADAVKDLIDASAILIGRTITGELSLG